MFPTLFETLCWDESAGPHVTKACHLLASDVMA